MDGVVYGTAAGLGFATGDALVRELLLGGAVGGDRSYRGTQHPVPKEEEVEVRVDVKRERRR